MKSLLTATIALFMFIPMPAAVGLDLENQTEINIPHLDLDKDKSKGVELDEWQKHFQKFANKKPNLAPKAADNDYYAR